MGGSYSTTSIAETLGLKKKSTKSSKIEKKDDDEVKKTSSIKSSRKLSDEKEDNEDEEDKEDEKEEDGKEEDADEKEEDSDEKDDDDKEKDALPEKKTSLKKTDSDGARVKKTSTLVKADEEEKETTDEEEDKEDEKETEEEEDQPPAKKSLLSGERLTPKNSVFKQAMSKLRKEDDDKDAEKEEEESKEDEETEKEVEEAEKEVEEAEKEDEEAEKEEKEAEKEEEEEEKEEEEAEKEEDKEGDDEKEDEEDVGEKEAGAVDAFSAFRAGAVRQPLNQGSLLGAAHKVYTGTNRAGGRVPGAGAQKANLKPRDMDRFKEILEQRKKMLNTKGGKMNFLRPIAAGSKGPNGPGGNVKLDTAGRSGDTKLMRANKPGTAEFEERKKQILARIAKAHRSKSRFGLLGRRSKDGKAVDLINKRSLPFKKEPKAPGIMRRSFEKVPVVKRIFKMTPEEELILDASLSFVTGLKHGVFMNSDSLNDKKKEALKGWLDLLSVSLPPEWGLHTLIDELNSQINYISQSNEHLQNIINKHPLPRTQWSPLCDKAGTGGFSCGMWKLLHIVTLGVAEHRGGINLVESKLMGGETKIFPPADAADAIRDYMEHFFGCDECRKHFIEKYDSCAFRRCDRLTDDEDDADADDWKQLALWMWEVHNDVSVRVANTKIDRLQKKLSSKHLAGAQSIKILQSQEDEIRAIWPRLDDCVLCFDDSGKWNENSVFEFLERTYWDAPNAKYDRLLTYRKLEGEDPAGGGIIWIMMLIALCVIFSLRRHVTSLAFHKNLPSINMTSVMGVGTKIGDVVAGKRRTQ